MTVGPVVTGSPDKEAEMINGSGALLDRPSTVTERKPPVTAHGAPRRRRSRGLMAWILLLVALAAAIAAAVLFAPSPSTVVAGPSDGPMGLSQQAWVEYRTGERASTPVSPLPSDWQTYRHDERASTTVVIEHGPEWQDYRSGERTD